MRVAVVGAFGKVGTAIIDHLDDHRDHQFTYVGHRNHPEHEMVVADATAVEELRPVFEGHDAVVHLALAPHDDEDDLDAHWTNLRMCHAVLDAATDADVETLIYGSTNHVVGTYEEEYAPDVYYPGHDIELDHDTPIRPDSLYGVGKAYGEALGRYAVDHVRCLDQFFALRIGTIRTAERDHPFCMAEEGVDRGEWERGSEAYEEMVARVKATWQSRRDFAHMIDCCLATEGAGFDVFYGVSDNDRRWFDIEHAREVIGYEPRDNGEEWDARPGRG